MEIYIVDAVAFLAYLADKLPKKADDIFRKAE
ncbi:MAG TPA: type II toxin-antitoxin system VapC family toxin, partial [archaeon]|nr:type II toxin-antitoxin system VapC family toxin [archaeon]